jgi:hypothetical protein
MRSEAPFSFIIVLPDVGNRVPFEEGWIFAKLSLHDGGTSVRHKSGMLTWIIMPRIRAHIGNRKLNNSRGLFWRP